MRAPHAPLSRAPGAAVHRLSPPRRDPRPAGQYRIGQVEVGYDVPVLNLAGVRHGEVMSTVRVTLPDGRSRGFGDAASDIQGEIVIHDREAMVRLLIDGGEIVRIDGFRTWQEALEAAVHVAEDRGRSQSPGKPEGGEERHEQRRALLAAEALDLRLGYAGLGELIGYLRMFTPTVLTGPPHVDKVRAGDPVYVNVTATVDQVVLRVPPSAMTEVCGVR